MNMQANPKLAGHEQTSSANQAADAKALRNALACFATGVCVVTTKSPAGQDVGLTANSFTSVSLDPPLVLWSLSKASSAMEAFRPTSHFAIHVLSADQEHLSAQFARKGIDRFSGVPIEKSPDGVPMLKQCAARFECRMTHQYEGGDHLIFVGEVLRFEARATQPLVFHSGQYREVAEKTPALPSAAPDSPMAPTDLSYLIWRAFLQFRDRYYEKRLEMKWSESDSYLLQMLAMQEGQTVAALDAAVRFTGKHCTADEVRGLCERGLVVAEEPLTDSARLRLTDKASRMVRELSQIARATEAEVLSRMPASDGRRLKHMLRMLIENTAPKTPVEQESLSANCATHSN